MQVAIELPKNFVAYQGEEATQHEIRLAYALWLYQQERISLTKAAKIAKVSVYNFMEECKKEKIPVINISEKELLQELEFMQLSLEQTQQRLSDDKNYTLDDL